MITVHYNGPIYAKGGVCGPILTPYKEDIETIFKMITQGIKVVEILEDGTTVVLNLTNFNTDNTPKKVEPEVKPVMVQQYHQNNNFNKFDKKKNKHNKFNNNYIEKIQSHQKTEEEKTPVEKIVTEPEKQEVDNSTENIVVDQIEEI